MCSVNNNMEYIRMCGWCVGVELGGVECQNWVSDNQVRQRREEAGILHIWTRRKCTESVLRVTALDKRLVYIPMLINFIDGPCYLK